jgi:hypothetical protein
MVAKVTDMYCKEQNHSKLKSYRAHAPMSSIPQQSSIKSSVISADKLPRSESRYVPFCQVCGWYGYSQEKIIREFEGFRSEDEDGFAYKFTEYDYDDETRERKTKHIHKYIPKLVDEAVDFPLKMRNNGSCQI